MAILRNANGYCYEISGKKKMYFFSICIILLLLLSFFQFGPNDTTCSLVRGGKERRPREGEFVTHFVTGSLFFYFRFQGNSFCCCV